MLVEDCFIDRFVLIQLSRLQRKQQFHRQAKHILAINSTAYLFHTKIIQNKYEKIKKQKNTNLKKCKKSKEKKQFYVTLGGPAVAQKCKVH